MFSPLASRGKISNVNSDASAGKISIPCLAALHSLVDVTESCGHLRTVLPSEVYQEHKDVKCLMGLIVLRGWRHGSNFVFGVSRSAIFRPTARRCHRGSRSVQDLVLVGGRGNPWTLDPSGPIDGERSEAQAGCITICCPRSIPPYVTGTSTVCLSSLLSE